MSYMKKYDYFDEIAVDNTIERLAHINKIGNRVSGNNRSYYINNHHDDTVYVPDTLIADENKSTQDAVQKNG